MLSQSLAPLKISERRRNRNSCPSQRNSYVFCECRFCQNPFLTSPPYLINNSPLWKFASLQEQICFLGFFLGIFLTEAYIFPFCDKQPSHPLSNPGVASKTPGVILLFSEKSGQLHPGVPEACGGTQGHARCGFNLD